MVMASYLDELLLLLAAVDRLLHQAGAQFKKLEHFDGPHATYACVQVCCNGQCKPVGFFLQSHWLCGRPLCDGIRSCMGGPE